MVRKLLVKRTDNVSIQVFRYVLSGGIAYAVDYASLIALTEIAGIYYLTSAAVAFIMGTAASYVMNAGWVFNKRTFESRRVEVSIFFVIGVVGIFVNHYCIWFFTEKAGLYYLYSKLVATMVVVLMNFFARKYILFR